MVLNPPRIEHGCILNGSRNLPLNESFSSISPPKFSLFEATPLLFCDLSDRLFKSISVGSSFFLVKRSALPFLAPRWGICENSSSFPPHPSFPPTTPPLPPSSPRPAPKDDSFTVAEPRTTFCWNILTIGALHSLVLECFTRMPSCVGNLFPSLMNLAPRSPARTQQYFGLF